MSSVVPTVVIIFAILVSVGFPILIGYVILKPYRAAVRGKKFRTQFMLTDFFWLLLQLQLALGFIVAEAKQMHSRVFTLALGFLAFAVIGMWCGAVAALSRAGIRRTARRGLFILVLVPGIVFLMMGTAIVFLGTFFGLMGWSTSEGIFGVATEIRSVLQAVSVIAIGAMVAVLVCWMLRRLTQWLVCDLDRAGVSASMTTTD
ncbi:MAG: hypothetical protein IH991_05650 [Planctomycetes bacterium]|nr:hypothetical protein [Planctomycetota bacterium]